MKRDVILSLFASKLGLLFHLCFGFKYKNIILVKYRGDIFEHIHDRCKIQYTYSYIFRRVHTKMFTSDVKMHMIKTSVQMITA